jgi:AcrR family transcriptional regulator
MMQDTRETLLDTAGGAFARDGYDRANVNCIAREAGFSIGTIYNYFPSKRDLMNAFIDEIGHRHVDFILEQVTRETDPARRLVASYQAGFAFIKAHLTQSRAMFNTLNGPDEVFKARLFEAYQPLFQLLREEILRPGVDQGVTRPVDFEATAGLLMLVYLGTVSQFTPEGKHWLKPKQVADFVLHALAQ